MADAGQLSGEGELSESDDPSTPNPERDIIVTHQAGCGSSLAAGTAPAPRPPTGSSQAAHPAASDRTAGSGAALLPPLVAGGVVR